MKVSGSDDTKTVTGVLGYVDSGTGDKSMLVVHQAILVPKTTVNLLVLMQLRDNDLKVNDEPKHMVLNPTDDHHCIIIAQSQDGDRMRIPLWIKGVTPTWKPTWQDFEGSLLNKVIELTNETVEWDPQ